MNVKRNVQFLILFIGLVGLPAVSFGQQSVQTKVRAVQLVIENLFEGLATLDTAKVKQVCAPDIIIMESGVVWTLDSLISKVLARKAMGGNFKRVNKFQYIETRISGSGVAWISYFNEATITYNDKSGSKKWLESAVLEKQKNQWRITLLHSTELK